MTDVVAARFQLYVSSERCFWRLLGGNNRGYGRGTAASSTLEQVREAARLASVAATTGTFDLASTGGRSWSWTLLDELGVAVAASDGTYGRRVECAASIQRFRLLAPHAPMVVARFTPRVATEAAGPSRPAGSPMMSVSPDPRVWRSSLVSRPVIGR